MLLAIFILYSFFAGYNDSVLALVFRWGEITVIFFLLAGIIKYIAKNVSLLQKPGNRLYPGIIACSFAITVLAGFLNLFSGRFAWENTLKDHPDFLFGVSLSVIESDPYFRHHPSKNKLALFISGRVYKDFVPSEIVLEKAGVSLGEYSDLTEKIVSGSETIFNKDDLRNLEILIERSVNVSRSVVLTIYPAMSDMKQWFNSSLYLMENIVPIETVKISDLQINGIPVNGTGDILKNKVMEHISLDEGLKESNLSGYISFNNFIADDSFSDLLGETFHPRFPDYLTLQGSKAVTASFFRTGYYHHISVRGVLRWIYRVIIDPLYSTFMAVMFVWMVLAAFHTLNIRSFSYLVITVSALLTMVGFLPFVVSSGYSGISSKWLMDVPSLSVFRAVLIGTGTGVLYVYFIKAADLFKNMREK